jgi:four helix bundle protein
VAGLVFEFEKLLVHQEARAFRQRIYTLTKLLPKWEFKLKIQMCDAARSMTNGIAEGHGRYTFRDRVHFCRISRGSLLELVDDIGLCDDEGYAKHEHLENLKADAAKVLRRLNGYIKYLETEANKLLAATKRSRILKKVSKEVPITNY